MRSIVHFYIPSFFAAVEQLKKPDLAGRAVLVTNRSGSADFVVSASSEAMAEGAREGMTVRHAGRYCPYGDFIPADWGVYKDISNNVLDILSGYSPLLEPHWLDRAYMDLTGCPTHVECGDSSPLSQLSNTHEAIHCRSSLGTVAHPRTRDQDRSILWQVPNSGIEIPHSKVAEAQRIIGKETGMTISAGIAQSKLIAHAAASVCKPGECIAVAQGAEQEFIAPLLVSHLPGVGPKIERRLLALGVASIGELAAIPCPMLVRQFGAVGSRLHRLAQGIDLSPVKALYPPESIIIEHTFDCDEPSEPAEIREYLLQLCNTASIKLQKRNQKSGCISLRLEFDDRSVDLRSYVPKCAISSTHEICSAAERVLLKQTHGLRVVSIRLTLTDLRLVNGLQLSFLEDAEKKMRLQAMLANIHAKFGERSIGYGTALAWIIHEVNNPGPSEHYSRSW